MLPLQVIIQGLREAGVYDEALVAGQALLEKLKSRDEFLLTVTHSSGSNSSTAASGTDKSGDSDSTEQRAGGMRRDAARQKDESSSEDVNTARRQLLQFFDAMPEAVPPLAPPSLSSLLG